MADAVQRLSGRTAIVTGGARGLGLAIVERLAAEGANVALLDVAGAQDAAAQLAAAGVVRGLPCDVTDKEEVTSVVASVVDDFGGLDILVNNAGLLSGRRSFLEVDKEEMLRYYEVNTVGYLHLAQVCFPHLRDSEHRGRIINIASRTFFTGSPGQLAYVASKGGVFGMTRVLARELGEHKITVNALMPSQVATPGTEAHSGPEMFSSTMSQQAIKEFVRPADFAGFVTFFATDDAKLITGQSVVFDGGGLLY